MECVICGVDEWRAIPNPVENRSITTSGVLLRQSLSKGQCSGCGLVRRIGAKFVGDSNYYEEQYGNYYRRPGAARHDAPRYAAMAKWMHEALGGTSVRSILDAGCGAGWSMRAMQRLFPDAHIEGIEPSESNAHSAREAGFAVHSGKIGHGGGERSSRYDLIYSINVLQHVLSPIDFLSDLSTYLSEQGLLVLICPDASRPSNEMLWCDHNYSFRPDQLRELAKKVSLRVRSWSPNPNDATLLDKQLIVLAKDSGSHAPVGRSGVFDCSPEELYRRRCNYVRTWQEVHRSLCERTKTFSHTFNFGASSWTWLLAGYCPEYWRKVEFCVVDQFGGKCLDKVVKPLSEVGLDPADGLVLGVNPVSQESYARRFQSEGLRVVRWDTYVHA